MAIATSPCRVREISDPQEMIAAHFFSYVLQNSFQGHSLPILPNKKSVKSHLEKMLCGMPNATLIKMGERANKTCKRILNHSTMNPLSEYQMQLDRICRVIVRILNREAKARSHFGA